MLKNKRGFTLIEVIIAMFILTIGMLALLNTAAVVIQNNMTNILRDEAVSVASARMNELKRTPFDSIVSDAGSGVSRTFRGLTISYTVKTTAAAAGTAGDTKSIKVDVTWNVKGKSYTHTITSVVNR